MKIPTRRQLRLSELRLLIVCFVDELRLLIITSCENWPLRKISESLQEENWDRVLFKCPDQIICRTPMGSIHMKIRDCPYKSFRFAHLLFYNDNIS